MRRTMVPWTERFPAPFGGFGRQMENLLERYFGPEEGWLNGGKGFVPTTNLAETETEYEVTVELPGLKPEEVKVELQNGDLVISGERREEKEEKQRTYHRIETSFGSFMRRIPIPGEVNETKVDAAFANGVLKVTLPKGEAARPKQIKVKT